MAIVKDHSHNLLIIEGKHSDQTRALSKILKDTFPEDNWSTITVDLASINEDLIRINKFIRANDTRTIIAYGNEAIFALAITDSRARIVINPCLHPHAEPVDNPAVNTDTLKAIEEATYDNIDGEIRSVTYGIFIGKAAPLSHQNFSKLYGCNNESAIETATGEITPEALTAAFNNSLNYFRKIGEYYDALENFDPSRIRCQ